MVDLEEPGLRRPRQPESPGVHPRGQEHDLGGLGDPLVEEPRADGDGGSLDWRDGPRGLEHREPLRAGESPGEGVVEERIRPLALGCSPGSDPEGGESDTVHPDPLAGPAADRPGWVSGFVPGAGFHTQKRTPGSDPSLGGPPCHPKASRRTGAASRRRLDDAATADRSGHVVDAQDPRELLARAGRLGPGGEHLLRPEPPEHPHRAHRRGAGSQHVHARVSRRRQSTPAGRRARRPAPAPRWGQASGVRPSARRRWPGTPTDCTARPPAGGWAGPACCSARRPERPPTADGRGPPGSRRRAGSRPAGARHSLPGTRR